MPDYLGKGEPAYGTVQDEPYHDDMAEERAWLQSSIRCFLDNDVLGVKKKPEEYRLTTFWWLAALDCAIRRHTGKGLEQFSSAETKDAVLALMGESASEEFKIEASTLFRSPSHEFQWLGYFGDRKWVWAVLL